ncbi:MAG: shikimate dehydrogenase [Nitrososphaerota archaeon]|nr:shikimate dehydrogenase [Candidatus Calditenuaceae archaeon]MDW8074073.1 shikimate dehydrogenase [Nitrososphaerota archaeon]
MALLAVLGYPIRHSASPVMHNAALRALDLPNRYIAIEVRPEELHETLKKLHSLGFKGLNVTIPHKEAAARHATQLSKEAEAIGAVNTLKRLGDGWAGYNTDVAGVLGCLSPLIGKGFGGAMVLGAGGSAAAAIYALWRIGEDRVVLANRSRERAEALARRVMDRLGLRVDVVGLGEAGEKASSVEVIVNATPLGLTYHESPIEAGYLNCSHKILDMVYSPSPTPLRKAAEAAGATYVDGVRMLVEQGAEAFKIFLGAEPDKSLMEKAVRSWLALRGGSR